MWRGKYEAARDQVKKASEFGPAILAFYDGWNDIESGKSTRALPEFQEANVDAAPAFVAAWLGYAYGASGDRIRARAMLEELNHRSLHGYIPPFNLAIVYLGMGNRARAMDYLEQAYSAHSQWLFVLKMDRIFDPLRSETRFIALLKKVNFER